MIFDIEGHIVPCQRVNAKGKYSPRAVRYHESQEAIKWQLRSQMQLYGMEMLPEKTPFKVSIEIEVAKCAHCADSDNLAKALIDSMQGVVFKNDSYMDSLTVSRKQTGRDFVRMEVYIL